jgi:hypothetical protein
MWSVNVERLFCNENLKLVKNAKQILFHLGNETSASLTAEVQNSHDNDQIKVDLASAVPDSLQREFSLLNCQTAEPLSSRRCSTLRNTPSSIDRPLLSVSGPVVVSQR